MPREQLTLQSFEKGLFLAVGPEEAPKGSYTWGSKDIDPLVEEGRVTGRQGDTQVEDATLEGLVENIHALIKENDGSSTFFYKLGTAIRRMPNFPSGTAVDQEASLADVTSMTLFGRTIRVGRTPATGPTYWIGYLPARTTNLFPYADYTAGWYSERTDLLTLNPAGTLSDFLIEPVPYIGADVGSLTEGTLYVYAFALEFDGFQVGPLESTDAVPKAGPEATATATGRIDVTINVSYGGYDSAISKRATAFLVFRAEKNPSGTDLFFLAGRVPIDDPGWTRDLHDAWFTFEDRGAFGESYKNLTGCGETQENNMIRYGIAAMVGGYLMVGQAFVNDTIGDEALFMVFRSQLNKPDMFNWQEDFARIPIIPKTIAGFQGRCYVFDETNMFRINPGTMEVEDRIQGIGCLSPSAVYTTEFGMFFADASGIYMHTGAALQPIGLPIAPKWKELMADGPVVTVRLLSAFQSVCFIIHGTTPKVFSYHLSKQRWDYWEVTNPGNDVLDNISSIEGVDGTVYLPFDHSGTDTVFTLATNAVRKAFTVITQIFNLGRPFENKRYYGTHFTQISGTAGTLQSSLDEAAYASSQTWGTRFKTIRLKFLGAFDTVISDISIVYRHFIGAKIGR